MPERDNFTIKTKRILGDRVGYRCSCPTCRRLTIGPTKGIEDISPRLLIAEASHISGAGEGGPRFNQTLTPEERKAVENGIWLCSTCHTMVDKDPNYFTDKMLRDWKTSAEEIARREVEGELIFSGYVDPAKRAEQHFKSQLQDFAVAHAKMGCEEGANQPTQIPIVWLQMVSISTLKELVKLSPDHMIVHMSDIRPVVSTSSWGTSVSRFGVHVAGYGGSSRCEKSLVQLFKDGSLTMGFVLFEHSNAADFGFDYLKGKFIPWQAVENRLFTSIEQGVTIFKSIGVQQTAFLRLVLPNVKGYRMLGDPGLFIQHHPAETDLLETSPSLVASFDLAATEIARPLLDEVWQYFGVWHSPSYDEKGEFIRNR